MIAGARQVQGIAQAGLAFAPPRQAGANLGGRQRQPVAPQGLRHGSIDRHHMQMRKRRASTKRCIFKAFHPGRHDPSRKRGNRCRVASGVGMRVSHAGRLNLCGASGQKILLLAPPSARTSYVQ